MTIRLVPILALTIVMGSLLSGCASGPLTVTPSAIATLAEDALEKAVGTRPKLDCGTANVPVVVGTVVNCVLTDPATSKTMNTAVTITKVDGSNYSVDVKVAG